MTTDNCNFTAYYDSSWTDHLYYGRTSIRKDFYIANYDENFFRFVGQGGYFPICDLIHPADSSAFLDAVEKLETSPQHLILRIKCNDGIYRVFLTLLTSNGRIIDGFHSFDMEISELFTIMDSFRRYDSTLDEYKGFLTLFSGGFFDYSFSSGFLRIFKYEARSRHTIFEDTLDNAYHSVLQNEKLNFVQKAEFEDFYHAVKNGRDYLNLQLDKCCFTGKDDPTRYDCRFLTTYLDGSKDHVVGLVHITDEAKSDKRYYETEAAYDPGTGILNKRAIHEYADDMIKTGKPGTYLAIIDVDNFKSINDNFGHMFGDEVLLKIAEILKEVMEGHGTPGRFGGDEFMLLIQNVESAEKLHRLLSTIMTRMSWAYENVEGLKLTASIGVSKYPEDGMVYDDLFNKADKSVYVAKAKGKNRYILYDEQKYGAVVKDESFRSNIGTKSIVSDEKKSAEVSNCVLLLLEQGVDALLPVMEKLQSYFDIDGIALYAGEDLKRILSIGKYLNPIESLKCIEEEGYHKYFDDYGWCQVSKMQKLENAPEAFRLFTAQENGKFIQCEGFVDGIRKAVISFDFFNRAPKYSETDLGLLKIVGRTLASVTASSSNSKA